MGRDDPLNGWIAALLFVLLGIFLHVYMQYQLNKAWQSDEMEALQGSQPAGQLGQPAHADLERIEKLSKLRSEGAITEEQFQAERERALGEQGDR
jgi:hypothetical protein